MPSASRHDPPERDEVNRSRVLEILALVFLAAIVVSVARSAIRSARLGSREEKALEIVRAIVDAEDRFRASALLDRNGNRVGEYVSLSTLVGDGAGAALPPDSPRLDVGAVAWTDGVYELGASGYLFAVYLPRHDGGGTRTIDDPEADPSLAERFWCLYAWPLHFGTTGRRVFFADAWKRIYQTENLGETPYEGSHSVPEWSAAFRDPSEGMKGRVVETAQHGADGRIWELLEEPDPEAKRGETHSSSESGSAPARSSRTR